MAFDLLAEMERDGFSTSRKSNSRSGQYNGPCIIGCGGLGRDRLRVQPNQGEYGWFICEHCNTKGTGIDYLMIKRGWSKQEALKYVGWKPRDGSTPNFIIPRHVLAGEIHPTHEAPCKEWQTSAKAFVQYCIDILWSEQGQPALEYLRARGLRDETIKAAQLGYNPAELERPGVKWGREKSIKLWQGIIIPWFIGEDLWRITIRDERVAEGSNRYKQIAGGSNGLYLGYLLGYDRPVVMVEGEIDALSIAQEAGHHVSVCATGTTEGSHTPRWIAALARKDLVLVAFDAEEKGDKASQWWMDRLENAHRLRPWWEDANQMLQDEVDLLNDWILPTLDSIADEIAARQASKLKQEPLESPGTIVIPDDSEVCGTCLDLDKETPAPYEADGSMYCAQHHPRRLKLESFIQQIGLSDIKVEYWPATNSARMRKAITNRYQAEVRQSLDYAPVSLPSLPRDACPCRTIAWNNSGEQVTQRCRRQPTKNGFCPEHQLAHELLTIGAQLDYPSIQVPFKWKRGTLHRTIRAGVSCWEARACIAHAERPRALEDDVVYLRSIARGSNRNVF